MTEDLFPSSEGSEHTQPHKESTMTSKTQVTRRQTTEVAIPMADLVADAGAGGEEMRSEDIQIPTLVIVQKMSPQMEESSAAYLPDARPGMICDTLTGRLWDGEQGVIVVPVHFQPLVNHMALDGEKEAFLASYPVTDPFTLQETVRGEKGRDMLVSDPGTFLRNVAQHFVLVAETCEPFVVRMKSTNLRPSKRWNALLQKFHPLEIDGRQVPRPRFSIECVLKTARQEKDGDTWHTWAPEIIGELTSEALYHAGRDLHGMLIAGKAVAAPEEPHESEEPPF